MKCFNAHGMCLLLGVCLSVQSFAQNKTSAALKNITSRLSFSVIGGVSAQQPIGSLIKSFKDDVEKAQAADGEFQKTEGKVKPIISYVAGIRIQATLNSKFTIQTGFQLTKRGVWLEQTSSVYDPRYMYDEHTSVTYKIKTGVLEIPLGILYTPNAKNHLELAIINGFAMRSSAKSTITLERKAIMNGKEDAEASMKQSIDNDDISKSMKGYIPGVTIGYFRKVYKDLFAGLNVQYSGNYIADKQDNVKGLCGLFTLRYHINPAIFKK